jgi:dehydrodolichyl diphosphate syntase complex subunit NUS1
MIQQQLDISDDENVVWGPHYQDTSSPIKFPHRNGYKRHIIINLYSSRDSYGAFNRLLTEELCKKTRNFDDETLNKTQSSRVITIESVDDKLSKLYGDMPDPELALFFGKTTCTAGFLPWHIRLTEFIQISYKLHHLSLDKFIRVLYKYAKCEQRFGK